MKKYAVIIEGKEKTLEIAPLAENRFRIVIDGNPHDIDVRFCTADTLSILMDNRSCDLSYSYGGEKLELQFRNETFSLEVLDEREQRMRRARSHPESGGAEVVKAFMPGKIVGIHVKPGDTVKPGSALLIIEAMKMENEIFSKTGGVVRSVYVKPGQTVDNAALLVEIISE